MNDDLGSVINDVVLVVGEAASYVFHFASFQVKPVILLQTDDIVGLNNFSAHSVEC